MKKILLLLAMAFSCATSFAQVPAVSATTHWQVYDGNNTWVPSALDVRTYCLAGAGVIPTGGTAGQVLSKIDGTNYNTQWVTSGGSGDIVNGGNTTGATVVIGTNDANSLDFETNNVTRLSITGGASTGGAITESMITANTTTVDQHVWRLNSSGSTSNGFGLRHLIQLESSTTDNRDAVGFNSYWAAGTDASRTSNFDLELINSAGTFRSFYRFQPGTFRIYTTSGGAGLVFTVFDLTPTSNFTLNGGSTGAAALTLATTGNSGITVSNNTSTSNVPMLTIGSSTNNKNHSSGNYIESSYLTQINPSNSASNFTVMSFGNTINSTGTSSGTVSLLAQTPIFTSIISPFKGISYDPSYTASSGAGTTYGYSYTPTFNLTSTHSGTQRAISINPTLTSLVGTGSFIAVDLPVNNTKAIAINQTGASTPNYLVGPTVVGSTTADASAALLVNSTTKGFGLPQMTSSQKNAISSPREGLMVYDTDLDGHCMYDGVKWVRMAQRLAATVAVGAGAGTGASATISGTDLAGTVTLTGGTSASASATVFTITFGSAFSTAPGAIIIVPFSDNAAALGARPVYGTAVSTTTATASVGAVNVISNGTVYVFAYHVIQ